MRLTSLRFTTSETASLTSLHHTISRMLNNTSTDVSASGNLSVTLMTAHVTIDNQSVLLQVVVGVVCTAILVMGVPTNILIIMSMAVYKNVQHYSNVFVASLSIKDLLFLSVTIPIFYIDFLQGKYPFGIKVCTAQMSLSFSLSISSVLELINIAVSRYVRVCGRTGLYRQIYTRFTTVFMTALTWMVGISLGTVLGVKGAKLDEEHGICFTEKSIVKAAILTSVLLITCVVTSFCYFKIFRKVHDSKVKIRQFNEGPHRQQLIKISLHKAIRDFWVFAIYALLLMPFIVINTFGLMTPRTLAWDMAKVFSYFNNLWNCIIYGLLNKQFRDCFARLLHLKCIDIRSNSVAPYTISDPGPSARHGNGTQNVSVQPEARNGHSRA